MLVNLPKMDPLAPYNICSQVTCFACFSWFPHRFTLFTSKSCLATSPVASLAVLTSYRIFRDYYISHLSLTYNLGPLEFVMWLIASHAFISVMYLHVHPGLPLKCIRHEAGHCDS